MAEQTTRQFGPDAQARRERKAARDASFKAAALDALDVGKGWSGPGRGRDPFEPGVELATKRPSAAVELGRPLKPSERREIKHQVLAKQAGKQQTGRPTAGQAKKPTIDEYLESLTERQRDEIEESGWFRGLDDRHQADVRRRLALLEEVEQEAQYEFDRWREEQELETYEDDADVAAAISGPLYAGDPEDVYDDDFEEDEFEEEEEL
jgi:hypothetical protein